MQLDILILVQVGNNVTLTTTRKTRDSLLSAETVASDNN